MKNIKLYESFENYYEKIDAHEFINHYLGDENFNEKEILVIDNILPKWNKDSRNQYPWCRTYHSGKFYIVITKHVDEWYLVRCYIDQNNIEEYYKCDQFEGLIKCLTDKLIYKV